MKSGKFSRVLYVASNEEDFLVLKAMLGDSGVQIVPAETIAKALRMAKAQAFDLFLLETRFSDGSGFELCKEIRKINPHTPAVFYSGDVSETDKQKGLASGASAYFAKPYIDVLAATLNHLFK